MLQYKLLEEALTVPADISYSLLSTGAAVNSATYAPHHSSKLGRQLLSSRHFSHNRVCLRKLNTCVSPKPCRITFIPLVLLVQMQFDFIPALNTALYLLSLCISNL
jgi:hypothetical protein